MCVKQCLLISFKAIARSFSEYKSIVWGSASRTLGVLSRMMTSLYIYGGTNGLLQEADPIELFFLRFHRTVKSSLWSFQLKSVAYICKQREINVDSEIKCLHSMQTFFKQASFILHIIKFLLFTEPHSIKHVVHVHGHSQN